MHSRSLLLFVLSLSAATLPLAGATAFAADASPGSDKPAAQALGPVSTSDLDAAFDTVAEAARETDPVK